MAKLQTVIKAAPDYDSYAAFEAVAGAVGGAMFAKTAAAAIRSIVPLDRVYLFDVDGPRASRLLFAEYETLRQPTSHDTYVSRYLPVDPILDAVGAADDFNDLILLRVAPQDISEPSYRRQLETAGIVERVSLVRRNTVRWRCLTIARCQANGMFTDDELTRLASFTRLLLPLAARHEALTTEGETVKLTVAQLEDRFDALNSGLSPREVAVCARAAFGMTVEGAALDLNIGRASVLTYRKRAYARLNMTSANELCKLVMR